MVRHVEIDILGPLRLTIDGNEVRLPAKLQILLAVLALEPEPVSTERLLVALWGEDVAPTANKTLQSHVFQLRRTLASGTDEAAAAPPSDAGAAHGPSPASIVTEGRGYRLVVDPVVVDARRFEGLVADARRRAPSEPRAAVSGLTDALALWRGQTGADVGDEPVARAELERLVELRHGAFEEFVRLRLSLGEAADVIPNLRRELRAYPYREPLWGSLMRALDASGRKAEALLAFREAAEALRRELDVEPDDELSQLAAHIRDGTNERPYDAVSTPTAPATRALSVGPTTTPVTQRRLRPSRSRRSVTRGVVVAVVLVLVVAGIRLLPMDSHGSTDPDATTGSVPPSVVGTANLEMLDAAGQVTANAQLGANPDGIAAGAGSLWVTDASDGTVSRVDEAAGTIVQRIAVGNGPTGIAYGFGAMWVADSDDRTVSRIDPASDQVVATVDVGTAPADIAVDDQWVWVTNRLDHSLTRIDPNDDSAWAFAVGTTPLGLTVANGSVWVADAGAGSVAQVDRTTGTVIRTVAVGSDPTSVAASPSGDSVWVANSGSGTVFRIDTASATVTAAQAVGSDPTDIVVTNNAVWVATSGTNEVVRLDPTTAAVLGRTALSGSPRSLMADGSHVAIATDVAAGSHDGGTLRVLLQHGGLSVFADPSYADWGSAGINSMVYDALVTYKRVDGPDGLTLVPDLATEIPVPTDDGRTWTFRLRSGLVYSDGEPVRASDALGSFERAALSGNAGGSAGLFGNIEIVGSAACSAIPPCDLGNGITTDDQAGTITFHLTAPDLDFPGKIFNVPLVPAGTSLGETAATIPGTGPYEIAAFNAGYSERLTRNPLFHEWSHDAQPSGNPAEIDIAVSNDADPTMDVLSGAADVFEPGTASAARLAQLRVQAPAQLRVEPPNQTWLEKMNTSLPPFDDPRVREAVNLATDRQALVAAWGGPLTATVTCQLVPPDFAGYKRYCPWTVDPDSNGNWLGPDLVRARTLIDQSGTRGQSVTVWGIDDSGQHAAIARYFASLLDELGYRTTTRLMDVDTYFPLVAAHPEQVQMSGEWVMVEDRQASELITGSFTCPTDSSFAYQGQPSEWCDPTVDARVQSALTEQDINPVGADQAWSDIDHAIVDAAPAVMAFNPTSVDILSQRTGGYEVDPEYGVLYDQLWVR